MMVRLRRLLLTAAPLFCLLSALGSVPRPTAAQDPCDPSLIQPGGDPLGYGPRGDRCEGLYVKEVAGSAGLLVASFTQVFDPFDVSAGRNLNVEWTPPGNVAIRLRAVGLRRRLYYRMDTRRPPGATSYLWPADTLAALKIHSKEIGIVGWASYPIGDQTHEVYVPLRIGKPGTSDGSRRYVLVLLPGVDLTEVFLSLSTVEADGRVGGFVKKDEALRYGYYPAERPITVPLPEPRRQGLYAVQLGAILRQGGTATRSLYFYHPGG